MLQLSPLLALRRLSGRAIVVFETISPSILRLRATAIMPSSSGKVRSGAILIRIGVGLPPTQPSLGTLIRIGHDYLFSGEWWITVFPGVMLITIALSVNLLGDWLRDALNPRLR